MPPDSSTAPHRACLAYRREACGFSEPQHATSVNGRAVEPKNSVGSRRWRVSARRLEDPARSRGCRIAMAEIGTCVALPPDLGQSAISARKRSGSTEGTEAPSATQPRNAAAIAAISKYSRNHQFRLSCSRRCEIRLKPKRLTPTFTSYRDRARKSWVSALYEPAHLHSIALYPDGLSGPVRRTTPSHFAPLPNP